MTERAMNKQATNDDILDRLGDAPIVPLIEADDPAIAIRTTEALLAGGLTVIEVVLRSAGALKCLEKVSSACPDAIVGAGTVLSADHAGRAIEAGARFIVSPGLDEGVIKAALSHELVVFPGVATASEVQRAWNMGLRTVKFFPASLAGGAWMIGALSAAFKDMRFLPTGGISEANLKGYLALPSVIACGGSWLTPKAVIKDGNFEEITKLAEAALSIAEAAGKRIGG